MSDTGVIIQTLNAVKRRMTVQRFLDMFVLCSVFSGTALAATALVRLFVPQLSLLPQIMLFAVYLGIISGVILCSRRPLNTGVCACETDRVYQLKDRMLTATELLKRQEFTPLEQLQLEDAGVFAEKVAPKVVAPYHLPPYFKTMFAVFAAAVIFGSIPPFESMTKTVRAKEQPDETLAVAQRIQEEIVKDIEELAEKNPDERTVKELSKKMKDYVKQLEAVKNDRKETLATLSEMEEELRKAIKEMNLGTGEQNLKKIGDALSAAQATQDIGEALKEGKFTEAKQQLQKFDGKAVHSMTAKERETVSKMMEEFAKGMEKDGLKNAAKPLADAAKKMGDAMTEGNAEKAKEAAGQIAEESAKQAAKKEIAEGLEGKLSMLGLNKADMNSGAANEGDGADNGGESTHKASQESKNWGAGAAGKPNEGKETNLEAKREKQNISGSMLGDDGESEYEKFRTNELSKEQTSQQYKESFQEYKQQSESVLESEPLPLGQRQIIRRYFKNIEPKENADN
ncbi:MAG: hypothetical protein LBN39_10420 [Planctomycetaceae bacterium]|jgi:Asp-tRNA(Asn)/Glu-tRNA(Gln) amidotransferase C subunit|nr:hypothetical protein [Planctomycetaceae bacterium]